MQTFLVGGALREELLGLPVKERDWVVVGETPESLVEKGFKPVGKGFPVFLHPQTHEEYALARTEQKIAPGYRGFNFRASPEVTLEQDLMRRDLTINAIARDAQGRLIDPHRGRRDIELRLLRHVSAAFCEDPVRILRVARFAARYAHLGFKVAAETEALMTSMVEAGEVDALVPERVWAEFVRALAEKTPVAFITVLRRCRAYNRLFPELERLFGLSLPGEFYIETDAGRNCLLALENAARIAESPLIRFAALVHGLGKAESPGPGVSANRDLEARGLTELNRLCERLRVPGQFRSLAAKILSFQESYQELLQLSAEQLVDLLHRLKALRKDADLKPFLSTCDAINLGRKGSAKGQSFEAEFLLECQTLALSIDVQSILQQGFSGASVGKELDRIRVSALKGLIARRLGVPDTTN